MDHVNKRRYIFYLIALQMSYHVPSNILQVEQDVYLLTPGLYFRQNRADLHHRLLSNESGFRFRYRKQGTFDGMESFKLFYIF